MLSFRIAINHIKKKKETCLFLFLFLTCAILCTDLGFFLIRQSKDAFFGKCKELDAPTMIVPCNYNSYTTKYEDYLTEHSDVSVLNKTEAATMSTTKNNRNRLELGAVFYNMDETCDMNHLTIIESDDKVPMEKAIYVPYQLKKQNVPIGAPYHITCNGSTYEFLVAGYFESTYYCTSGSGVFSYYVPNETYEKLASKLDKSIFLLLQFPGSQSEVTRKTQDLKQAFLKDTTYADHQDSMLLDVLSFKDMEDTSIQTTTIGISFICAIAILLCIIIVIILMNHIKESIHDSMISIGVLESLGYTSHQIILSYLYEFVLLTLLGSLLGVALSYLLKPVITPVISISCGFVWKIKGHVMEDLISSILVLSVVILSTCISVRLLHKVPPVDAFSQKQNNRSIKHTFFPLHRGKGSIHTTLAFKHMMTHKKSNLVYSIVITLSTFTIGIALLMFLNFVSDKEKLGRMTGMELADLRIQVPYSVNLDELSKELLSYDDIRKVNQTGTTFSLKYNDSSINTMICKDYSATEWYDLSSGSLPVESNEIAISYSISKSSGKKAGDAILLSYHGYEQEFLVSGVFSSLNGDLALLTLDGIHEMDPQYRLDTLDVYLHPGYDCDTVRKNLEEIYKVHTDESTASTAERKISKLLADYGVTSVSYSIWKDGKQLCSGNSDAYKMKSIQSLKTFCFGQLNSFASMLQGIVILIFFITTLIMIFVLRMIMKSMLQKSRIEYGILKSLGYTTKDIVLQISLSYAITSFVGSMIGGILACTLYNPFFQSFFELLGVQHFSLTIHPIIMIFYCCTLCILLFFISILLSYRVRHITPYDLLTE